VCLVPFAVGDTDEQRLEEGTYYRQGVPEFDRVQADCAACFGAVPPLPQWPVGDVEGVR